VKLTYRRDACTHATEVTYCEVHPGYGDLCRCHPVLNIRSDIFEDALTASRYEHNLVKAFFGPLVEAGHDIYFIDPESDRGWDEKWTYVEFLKLNEFFVYLFSPD
jgi:hypothetical protein